MKQLIVLVVCLLLGCSTGALATVDPVAYWSFNNPVDLGHDDSGNGHNGIGATTSTTGSWGNAGNFDGASYLNVADATDLNPTSAITITAWFKADSFNYGSYSWPNIVRKSDNDGSLGYEMEIQRVYENNPCAGFGVELKGQGWCGPVGVEALTLTPGTWYFLAGVYDGTAVRMYLGTSELPPLVVMSTNYSGNIVPSSNNLTIGNALIYGDRSFDGAIDEVRIFDRGVTSGEITNLYLYNALTPEPSTLLLLGIGGLMLRKHK